MKFFEGPSLILILVAALIILGPDKLPQLGKVLGRTIRSVREGLGLAAAETERDPEKPTVNKEE